VTESVAFSDSQTVQDFHESLQDFQKMGDQTIYCVEIRQVESRPTEKSPFHSEISHPMPVPCLKL
jgi:hypothetical protein